jgi:hypothetical protein
MPHEIRQKLAQARLDGLLMVLGVVQRCHGARVRCLVESLIGQADRKGRQVAHANAFGEHRDEQA